MALTLTHVDRGLNASFQQAMSLPIDERLSKLMMPMTSNGRQENMAWMENVGQLREVIDEVTIDGVYKSNFSIVNKTYAKAISVRRDDLDDDQIGGALASVAALTVRARMFPQKLLIDRLIDGTSATLGLCYDGGAFFKTTHSTGDSGSQSNLLTGTGVTLAQITTDFEAARAAMMAFKDGAGEPILETDTNLKLVVVCPPAIFARFEQLANAAYISQTENVLKGSFEPIMSSRLTDVNDWYLLNVGMPLKPFVEQTRQQPTLERLAEGSDMSMLKERFVWKVRRRGNVGYGFWQMAIKTTNT